jgi:hypothetical protein
MKDWIINREQKLREFFELARSTELISLEAVDSFDVAENVAEHLEQFNLEWHIIPSDAAVSVEDSAYRKRLYPMFKRELKPIEHKKTNSYRAVIDGHRRHQGRIIGVETTAKPKYLPENRQLYGTPYGFEPRVDPFKSYMQKAGFTTSSRYGHNYQALREFVNIVNDDWNSRRLMPKGFRLTICPPVVFNLIGTVFHLEWSLTESLELGFYRDVGGNAKCYAVGSNAPDDFSYISEIESASDWTYLGFRTALVPDE